jgi:signal transduction histidine kinase
LHEPAIRLGLSLVKEVVDLQGGKILMQSGPQKGSTFSIVLPVSKNGRRKGGEMAAENFTNN